MAAPSWAIPASILVGSAVIAAGLYFGLQSRPVVAPANPIAAVPEAVNLDAVRGDVARTLEAARPALARSCWSSKPTPDGGASEMRWMLNFNFDAQGRQVTRGIVEQRRSGRPEITKCLESELPTIQVAAPGAPAYVELPFTLP